MRRQAFCVTRLPNCVGVRVPRSCLEVRVLSCASIVMCFTLNIGACVCRLRALELPAYSTREIMEEKFIYAITQTVTMNADEENMDDRHQQHDQQHIDYSEEE